MTKLWETLYDDTDSTYVKACGGRRFHFIELVDRDDACGFDNEGNPRYCATLSEVDLEAIPDKTLDAALDCSGMGYRDRQMVTDVRLAEECARYGAEAPLYEDLGGNRRELIRGMKCRSANLQEIERTRLLQRPVNLIGSTALEYMQGDLERALRLRPIPSPTSTVCLTKASSPDPLAFVAGYMQGQTGGIIPAERDDLAPAYLMGYRRGVNVKMGIEESPDWIQGES